MWKDHWKALAARINGLRPLGSSPSGVGESSGCLRHNAEFNSPCARRNYAKNFKALMPSGGWITQQARATLTNFLRTDHFTLDPAKINTNIMFIAAWAAS